MYKIKKYSLDRAKELGVKIFPSKKEIYKIDIFDRYTDYITSIGDKRFLDYPTSLELYGEEYANEKRKLFYKIHGNYSKYSIGWYSSKILW